jgi:hypothetical protein
MDILRAELYEDKLVIRSSRALEGLLLSRNVTTIAVTKLPEVTVRVLPPFLLVSNSLLTFVYKLFVQYQSAHTVKSSLSI